MIIIVVLIIFAITTALAHVIVRRGKKILAYVYKENGYTIDIYYHQYVTILTVYLYKIQPSVRETQISFQLSE